MTKFKSPTRRQAMASLATLVAAGSLHSEETLPSGRLQVSKVLFLGNSITLHSPAPQIGWTGNHGMAASQPELDYVHRLLKSIGQHTDREPESKVRNIADFERGHPDFSITEKFQVELEFSATLVIVAIGENVSALTTEASQSDYAKAFAALLDEIGRHGSPTILVRSSFWADAVKDRIMQTASQKAKAVWVDMSDLGRDEKNFARSERMIEHAGVAGHPGDRGMQAIADRLWKAITEQTHLWK